MAATTKVKDLLWLVSTLLDDVAPAQFNRWSEQELVHWLNDAQLAVTKYLPAACSRIDSVKLKPGTLQSIESILAADIKQYDGTSPGAAIQGVQPLEFICNMGADGLTPGDAISAAPVVRRVLDTTRPNWHAVPGSKVRQVVYNPETPLYFHVQPGVPASPAVWIRMAWIVKPTLIPNTGSPGSELYLVGGGSATAISVDDVYKDDLIDYICARAFMKNADFSADPQRAAFYTQRFLGSLNLRIQALTGNNPNLSRLPFAPEPIGAAK